MSREAYQLSWLEAAISRPKEVSEKWRGSDAVFHGRLLIGRYLAIAAKDPPDPILGRRVHLDPNLSDQCDTVSLFDISMCNMWTLLGLY